MAVEIEKGRGKIRAQKPCLTITTLGPNIATRKPFARDRLAPRPVRLNDSTVAYVMYDNDVIIGDF